MSQGRLRQAPNLQIHPVPDGYVVYHAQTGQVHHLNATAALLLELCNGQATSEEVVALVQQAFGLTGRAVHRVSNALAGLMSAGLVSSTVVAPRAMPVTAVTSERPGAPRARRRRPARARPVKPSRSKPR